MKFKSAPAEIYRFGQQRMQRAAVLIRRLLSFARREPVDPQATDANQVISGLTDLPWRTLGDRIELALRLAPDLWPVFVDPFELENALVNLAINARDAMAGAGRLTVETLNCRFDYASANTPPADTPPGSRRRLRFDRRGRYRVRHDRGNPRQGVRPVLYDQGAGQGNRTLVIPGPEFRYPVRRLLHDRIVNPEQGRSSACFCRATRTRPRRIRVRRRSATRRTERFRSAVTGVAKGPREARGKTF